MQYRDELSFKYFLNMESIGYDKQETLDYLNKLGGDK